MRPLPPPRAALAAMLLALCAACATVPPAQQAFAVRDGVVTGTALPCTGEPPSRGPAVEPLAGPLIRMLSWNLHKNDDPGWEADLARFAADNDLLLIQEAALTDALQRVLADAGHDWLLASAFTLNGHETGVLNASRVRPLSVCVQRAFEPLLQLPKSALIARYALTGSADATLAVANLHAINFTLGLDAYRAQLDAVAQELAGHRGPVIVAGDFNTWSAERLAAVEDAMRRMGLTAVRLEADTRSRFFDHTIDHVFIRGLELVQADAPEVASSDHNPVRVTLRLPGAPRRPAPATAASRSAART